MGGFREISLEEAALFDPDRGESFPSVRGDVRPSVIVSFHLSVPSSLRHLDLSAQGPEGG